MKIDFSIERLFAIMSKEFILMRRDPAVIAIMAVLPLILICIAGYGINLYPKNVPTVLINFDNTDITRNLIQGMKNTGYFSFIKSTSNSKEAYHLVKTDQALFVLSIPAGFTTKLLRHENPAILLEDGGIDSLSTGKAIVAMSTLTQHDLQTIQPGALQYLMQKPYAFRIISHRLYDPDHITQYYVVPGMIGLVLMLTMLMITTVIAFRDIQGGTIEYLLTSPARPSEILLGEIFSYIVIGYIQLILGLILSFYLFHVPFVGSPMLFLLCALPYIIAQLSLGLTIATFCASQFEAVQVVNLFIAFSILLTGFDFPFFAMPDWAQYIGFSLPLTYFFRILYGIMLKGNVFSEVWPNLWPLILYSVMMISLAVIRFKRHFH